MFEFIGTFVNREFSMEHQIDIWKHLPTGQLYMHFVNMKSHELLGKLRIEPKYKVRTRMDTVPDIKALTKEDFECRYRKLF